MADIFSGFKKTFRQNGNSIASGMQKFSDSLNLHNESSRIDSEINAVFAELGKDFYNNNRAAATAPAGYEEAFARLNQMYAQLADLEKKIAEASGQVKCLGCGNILNKDDIFCSACGTRRPADPPAPVATAADTNVKICPNCHTINELEDFFCLNCGQDLRDISVPTSAPEPVLAPAPEPAPEPEFEPTTEPEPASVAEPEPEPTTEPEPASTAEPDSELIAEPASTAEPDSELIAEPASTADLEFEPTTEPEPASIADPEPELIAEPASIAEPEPEPTTELASITEPDPESAVITEPEPPTASESLTTPLPGTRSRLKIAPELSGGNLLSSDPEPYDIHRQEFIPQRQEYVPVQEETLTSVGNNITSTSRKTCPNCSQINDDNATFCENCGYKLDGITAQPASISMVEESTEKPEDEPHMVVGRIFCPECGEPLPGDSVFCFMCGTKIE